MSLKMSKIRVLTYLKKLEASKNLTQGLENACLTNKLFGKIIDCLLRKPSHMKMYSAERKLKCFFRFNRMRKRFNHYFGCRRVSRIN